MKVAVYVEGPSDKAALSALLTPLLKKKQQEGIQIDFFETPEGDRKTSVLTKVPVRAVNIICHNPSALVVAMPDLYPKDKAFPHQTAEELTVGIMENFKRALQKKRKKEDVRLIERFKVFCLKHDLEALLLAAEKPLQARLKVGTLTRTWRHPVEDQNHECPPKRIIEELFRRHGQR